MTGPKARDVKRLQNPVLPFSLRRSDDTKPGSLTCHWDPQALSNSPDLTRNRGRMMLLQPRGQRTQTTELRWCRQVGARGSSHLSLLSYLGEETAGSVLKLLWLATVTGTMAPTHPRGCLPCFAFPT